MAPDSPCRPSGPGNQRKQNLMTDENKQTPEKAPEEQERAPHPREVIKRLAEVYPDTFFTDGRKVRPLAIGLIKPLLAEREEKFPEVSARQLRRAVRFYTQALAYHRAVLDGTPRVDLEGKDAGEVTEKEQEYAKERLETIRPPRKKPAGKKGPKGEQKTKGKSRPKRRRPARSEKKEEEKPQSTEDKLAALQAKFNGK